MSVSVLFESLEFVFLVLTSCYVRATKLKHCGKATSKGRGQNVYHKVDRPVSGRLRESELKDELTHSDWLEAERFPLRLTNLDGEFRTYHLAVVDLREEDNLEKEQAGLDDHDDTVTGLLLIV